MIPIVSMPAYFPLRQSQRANPLVQVRPLHAQRPRRARHVPVGFIQRAQNVLALGRLPRLLNGRFRPARAAPAPRPESNRGSAARRCVRIAMRSITLRSSRALPGQP